MALFGKGNDEAELQAEVDRLEALPLDVLAAEIFGHIDEIELDFGAWGPTAHEVAEAMAPSKLKGEPAIAMVKLVAEGLQLLEHAQLVQVSVGGSPSFELQYALTRAGHEALGRGDVSERLPR